MCVCVSVCGGVYVYVCVSVCGGGSGCIYVFMNECVFNVRLCVL